MGALNTCGVGKNISLRILSRMFGVKKLEWRDYQMVKIF